MSDAQRVIDEIDALIDEQMAGGEPETGYDFDDPDFPECRCGLDWHGLPTGRCPGSDTEGPLRSTGMVTGRSFPGLMQHEEAMIGVAQNRLRGYYNGGRIERIAPNLVVSRQWLESNDWVPLGTITPGDGLTFGRGRQ